MYRNVHVTKMLQCKCVFCCNLVILNLVENIVFVKIKLRCIKLTSIYFNRVLIKQKSSNNAVAEKRNIVRPRNTAPAATAR